MKYGRNSVRAWVVHSYVSASLIDTEIVPYYLQVCYKVSNL